MDEGDTSASNCCGALNLAPDPHLTEPMPHWQDVEREVAASFGLVRSGALYESLSDHRYHVKVQKRRHERLSDLSRSPLLERPAKSGEARGLWWAILEQLPGREAEGASAAGFAGLGRVIRRWHDETPMGGLRFDGDEGLSVFLGTILQHAPQLFPGVAGTLDEACRGLPMVPIHGDLAHDHNALYADDRIVGVIDPGGVCVGPAALDVAFAASHAIARSGMQALTALLSGYGDTPAGLERVMPAVCARTIVDLRLTGRDDLAEELARSMGEHPLRAQALEAQLR